MDFKQKSCGLEVKLCFKMGPPPKDFLAVLTINSIQKPKFSKFNQEKIFWWGIPQSSGQDCEKIFWWGPILKHNLTTRFLLKIHLLWLNVENLGFCMEFLGKTARKSFGGGPILKHNLTTRPQDFA